MPIDTGIYANLLRPPRSVADYDAEHQRSQLNALAVQGARMKAEEYQRGIAEQDQLRQAVRGFGQDETANYNSLLSSGFLKDATGYRKTLDDRAETQAKTKREEALAHKDTTQARGYALDQSIKAHEFHVQQLAGVNDPQTAVQWAQEGLKMGVFTPEQFERGLQALQQSASSPQTFAQWKQKALQGGASATEQLRIQAEASRQADTVRHQDLTRDETKRSHQANEQTAAGQLGVSRGNLGVAQGNLGLSRERLAQEKAGGGGGGMAKPSAAQEKATIEREKAGRHGEQMIAAIDEARSLLNKAPTASGIGAMVDKVGRAVGMSSDSAKTAAQLETLSGWMVANVPRMEGPQSNFDVENYKTMAAKAGDRTVPVSERLGALNTLEGLHRKYADINGTPLAARNKGGASGGWEEDKEARYQAWKKAQGK